MYNEEESICQCNINGVEHYYDTCHPCEEKTLEELKKSHSSFDYMGKGKIIFINNVKQIGGEKIFYYFFKRK